MYGVFYRPPNADASYLSLIEDSIALARETDISDLIVTGDFNLNTCNSTQSRKIESICSQFDLTQCIDEPTHFTENSASTIDLLLVSNKSSILTTGAGEPCLDQNIRYHCPIYGVFNFLKPKHMSFKRIIWKYDLGNYNRLRHILSEAEWNNLKDASVDNSADNVTKLITETVKLCIPNTDVTIKPQEPKWMNSDIKRKIRQRKRQYRKAKRSNNPHVWQKFRKLRNEVVSLIRQEKQSIYERLSP